MRLRITPSHRSDRSGLTLLESLGCLMAVLGGAWLGAIYMGIDVPGVAHSALAESKLIQYVPEQWRPTPPAGQESISPESLAASLQVEMAALRREITALRRESGPRTELTSAETSIEEESLNSSDVLTPTRIRTLTYWNRLKEIATGETALQSDAETAFSEDNAAMVFALKGRVSRFAAKGVDAIPDYRVEPALIQFGQQLATWYEEGGELYDQATWIWESAARDQGRAQLTRDWNRSDLQHRNEAQLLRDKAVGVQDMLNRLYGDGFLPFVPRQDLPVVAPEAVPATE